MDESQAIMLISKGKDVERKLRGTAQLDEMRVEFGKYIHVSIPGTSGYYQIGNLKHGETRELFLMYLGSN